ncbi:S1C family serine protease [Streptomyces sp. NBC_00343]|uniref:S1C family serine protease n=1 Tax=Streptomyces sp. NBC_00343 TaxID=2975719 RepID=UPI002E2A50E3|nr:trypsin-like peptidase domain-containing protein [Streptomyces sp. NBC_00343]
MSEPPTTPGAVLPPTGRPKPLHDPDPYSTPPYGEPGPWALAPPVQHPAVTSAPVAAPQAHTAVPGTPGPYTAPVSPGTPAPAFVEAVPPGTPASSVTTPAFSAAAAPAITDTAPPGTPASSVTTPVSSAPAAPAITDTASPGTPAPGADTSAPGISAPLVPPAPPHSAASTAACLTPADPARTPVVPDQAPASTNPWHRYDPWATPAPLQTGTPDQHRTRTRKLLAASALALALVSGGVGGVVGAHLERDGIGGDVVLPQAGKEDAQRVPGSVAGIAARALPSVVTLHVSGDEESGTGTGIVLDRRGHILTNNHVVRPAGGDGAISVRFSGGQTVKGKVVGRDTGYDLAVVQVSGVRGLTPMPLGNSDNVRVGDPVVAIGAPFDLDNTVTSGIISAKERPITAGGEASDGSDVSYVDALQTDAPINPGNSGGPLLDARGRLVGVNSAIRSADYGDGGGDGSEQGGSIGLGFAIPVNQAKLVAEELINTGKATHPVIGVTLDLDYAGDGARVASKGGGDGPAVTPGGAGAKAGLKAGDVITEVDGVRVHSGDELIVRTRAHRPGDQLRLTLRRGGEEMTLSLVLGSSTGD